MSLWEMRSFDADELVVVKLCLKMKFLTEDQLANIVQQSVGKHMVVALHDSGSITPEQISQVMQLREMAMVCPHCQNINFQGEQKNYLVCKECHQVLQDDRGISTTIRRQQYGRYKIVKRLAEGSAGVVFEAVHVELNRTVALKVLKNDPSNSNLLLRFKLEAKAIAQLNHPNIVGIYDIGEEYGSHYIAMEYVKGRPLSELITEKEISIVRAAEIVKQVASGLEHAHRHTIIHRDIKPENIMICEDGIPKITDFGLARQLSQDVHITQQNTIMGTPLYMSPEQAEGSDDIKLLTDIYSLGVVLYEMLTGKTPFYNTDTRVLLNKIINDPVKPPHELSRIPPSLEKICLKALSKRPQDRYPSAQEMSMALDDFLKENHAPDLLKPRRELEKSPTGKARKGGLGNLASQSQLKSRSAQSTALKGLIGGTDEESDNGYQSSDLFLDIIIWSLLIMGLLYLAFRILKMMG